MIRVRMQFTTVSQVQGSSRNIAFRVAFLLDGFNILSNEKYALRGSSIGGWSGRFLRVQEGRRFRAAARLNPNGRRKY